jgi:hypothetical protein
MIYTIDIHGRLVHKLINLSIGVEGIILNLIWRKHTEIKHWYLYPNF